MQKGLLVFSLFRTLLLEIFPRYGFRVNGDWVRAMGKAWLIFCWGVGIAVTVGVMLGIYKLDAHWFPRSSPLYYYDYGERQETILHSFLGILSIIIGSRVGMAVFHRSLGGGVDWKGNATTLCWGIVHGGLSIVFLIYPATCSMPVCDNGFVVTFVAVASLVGLGFAAFVVYEAIALRFAEKN